MAELTNRREEIAPAVALASRAKVITDGLEEKRRLFYFHRRRVLEKSLDALGEEIRTLGAEEAFRIRWRDLWEQMYGRSLRERGELEERVKCLRGDREELLRKREDLRRSCFAAAAAVREIRSRMASLEGRRKPFQPVSEKWRPKGAIFSRRRTPFPPSVPPLSGKETGSGAV